MIRDGYYTVVYKREHDSGHRTFRVKTQAPDSNFAPGKQVIGFLEGSDNTSDYRGFAFIIDGKLVIWRKYRGAKDMTVLVGTATLLVEGEMAEKFGQMYARESGNCYICNRLLTDPDSIAAGIGPICAGRMVLA